MGGAVPRMALEQVANRSQDERQDDARRARRARARARSTPRRRAGRRAGRAPRVEQQRVDGRPAPGAAPSACRRSPAPSTSTASRARLGQAERRGGDAHPRRVALLGRERGERRAGRRPVAPSAARARSQPRTSPGARAHARARPAAARRRGTRPAPPRAGPARAAGRPARAGGSGSVSSSATGERTTRSSQRSASSKRPSHASAPVAAATAGARMRWVPPPVRLGDRDRLLAQPQPDGQRAPGRRPARGARGSRSRGTAVRCGARARAPARGGGARRRAAATTARRCRGSSAPRPDGRC